MKPITKQLQFKNALIHEVKSLKKNLKEEELNNIINSRYLINYENVKSCIYGLATGNCNSDRALRLMKLGCKKVVIGHKNFTSYNTTEANEITSKDIISEDRKYKGYYFWSPIEVYISPRPNDNLKSNWRERADSIIDYLSGEKKLFIPLN